MFKQVITFLLAVLVAFAVGKPQIGLGANVGGGTSGLPLFSLTNLAATMFKQVLIFLFAVLVAFAIGKPQIGLGANVGGGAGGYPAGGGNYGQGYGQGGLQTGAYGSGGIGR
uniref:Protein-export membrane protein SecG n=1 Tax=Panagrellus redivivus TaxID=6233 RepID=A0A7E4VD14_PANRE